MHASRGFSRGGRRDDQEGEGGAEGVGLGDGGGQETRDGGGYQAQTYQEAHQARPGQAAGRAGQCRSGPRTLGMPSAQLSLQSLVQSAMPSPTGTSEKAIRSSCRRKSFSSRRPVVFLSFCGQGRTGSGQWDWGDECKGE